VGVVLAEAVARLKVVGVTTMMDVEGVATAAGIVAMEGVVVAIVVVGIVMEGVVVAIVVVAIAVVVAIVLVLLQ
jgi:hypothetical protein